MTDTAGSAFDNLIALSKLDVALLALVGQRNKLQKELDDKKALVKRAEEESYRRGALLRDKQERYRKEEKLIKEEHDKLINRRKALASFTNYKVQQGAEKEIEQANKQLRIREDALLNVMEEIERLDKDFKAVEENRQNAVSAYEEVAKNAGQVFAEIEDEHATVAQRRSTLAGSLESQALSLYDRVRVKYPADPVVPVKEGSCSGCYMRMQPQVINNLHTKAALVRCPGCGRILYQEQRKEE